MKTTLSSLALLVVATAAAPALAQQLELPRPSPNAKVMQTLGLTEVTVDYSSPAVRGRKIWGGLLPFGEVWRAGANATTKITFSRDVTIGATPVPAGSYALFVIPTKSGWTFVINKDFAQGGAFGYKKELDVVRVDVKTQPIANRERLAYLFSDFGNGGGNLELEWEKLRGALPIKVATEAQAEASIKSLVDNAWQPYNQAARYELDGKRYDAGIALVERSMAIKEDWQNLWTKAQLLAGKGKFKEAYPLAERAQKAGSENAARFFFAEDVKKALSDWKTKL